MTRSGSSRPQANGGTSVPGRLVPKRFAPTPITHPVGSIVPIAVFTWSPISEPMNISPVSKRCPPSVIRTGPYVFLRFELLVPAPRLTHRPTTAWPRNPSCALLA